MGPKFRLCLELNALGCVCRWW